MAVGVMAKCGVEQRIVTEAIGRAFGREGKARNERPSEMPLDWDAVPELAYRQGLAPLVYLGLRPMAPEVPGDTLSKLKMGYIGAVAHTEMFLDPALSRLLAAMREANVTHVVLKGSALAHTAYPDPACRSMGDVDLLVPRGELDRAKGLLDRIGFRPEGQDLAPLHHHLPPHYLPGWKLGVELHHHLLPETSPYILSLDGCWSRCRTADIVGHETRILAPEDALHFTCLHLAYIHRYRWFLLRSLTDILAITTSHERDLDWDLLVMLVRESRSAGAVYWSLLLARGWLGAPIPEAALSALAPSPLMHRMIGTFVDPDLLLDGRASGKSDDEVLHNLLLNLSLYQGCSGFEQIKSILGDLFPPRDRVGHLSVELTHSRLRYATYLASPRRLTRGSVGFVRLLTRLPRR